MNANFFLLLTYLTGGIALGAVCLAYMRSRDTFHPMIYLGLMLFALYCSLPLQLFSSNPEGVLSYLSIQHLEFVQTLNLLGVVSICAGVLSGDRALRLPKRNLLTLELPPTINNRLKKAAIFLGFLGVLSFVYTIANVGGLAGAYGRSYGGGSAASGWVRDGVFLTLPALLWFMTVHRKQRLLKTDWALVMIFASPHIIQGLLGARRGPTAMIIIALVVGWYLIRSCRPSLIQVIIGGAILGFLMLFLVSNRDQIYIGSDLNFDYDTTAIVEEVSGGNEFIYGGGAVVNANLRNKYFWGRRYFTVFFIRPIPKQLWPTKYRDSSVFLGIPSIEQNLGVGADEFTETLGWAGSVGAAPGIIADMWIEFSWLFLMALYLIGWAYGTVWQRAVTKGNLWIPVYTLMTALSVYLITQTLEAMAFRFLMTSVGSWLIWRYGVSGKVLKTQHNYPN